MKFRISGKTLLCLLILTGLWTIFKSSALAQNTSEQSEICRSREDAQEQVRRLTDYELIKKEDQVKDRQILNLEKEIELLNREIELKDKIIAIKDMEIAATRKAFDDMKEISDRSLKLAETSKPKSNWEAYGLGILAAILMGILLVK